MIEPRSHRNYLRRTSDNSAIRESEEKMEWGEQSSPFICKVSYFAQSSNHRTLGAHSERAASRAGKGLSQVTGSDAYDLLALGDTFL